MPDSIIELFHHASRTELKLNIRGLRRILELEPEHREGLRRAIDFLERRLCVVEATWAKSRE